MGAVRATVDWPLRSTPRVQAGGVALKSMLPLRAGLHSAAGPARPGPGGSVSVKGPFQGGNETQFKSSSCDVYYSESYVSCLEPEAHPPQPHPRRSWPPALGLRRAHSSRGEEPPDH